MQPEIHDHEQLAARLADMDASSARPTGDATVANLKAELDTLASDLRHRPAEDSFER